MAALSLLSDENVDRQIVALLRRDGHEVLYVAELDPGINDDEVLRYAKERHALLLTADTPYSASWLQIQDAQRWQGKIKRMRFNMCG